MTCKIIFDDNNYLYIQYTQVPVVGDILKIDDILWIVKRRVFTDFNFVILTVKKEVTK